MAERQSTESTTEDAWAHTPEMAERLRRAREQRAYVLGPADLERIARDAEEAHAAGREYHATEAQLRAMEAKHLAPRNGRRRDGGAGTPASSG